MKKKLETKTLESTKSFLRPKDPLSDWSEAELKKLVKFCQSDEISIFFRYMKENIDSNVYKQLTSERRNESVLDQIARDISIVETLERLPQTIVHVISKRKKHSELQKINN